MQRSRISVGAGSPMSGQRMSADTRKDRPAKGPRLPELFVAFSTVLLSGFGGALPWTRRMIVERRRWMTAEEFNDAYSLCNFLPGPNM
jgi:chromate transporter